jgi:hypothetical protein
MAENLENLRARINTILDDDLAGDLGSHNEPKEESNVKEFTDDLLKLLLDKELLKEPLCSLRKELEKDKLPNSGLCINLINEIEDELGKSPKNVEKLVNLLDEVLIFLMHSCKNMTFR